MPTKLIITPTELEIFFTFISREKGTVLVTNRPRTRNRPFSTVSLNQNISSWPAVKQRVQSHKEDCALLDICERMEKLN